MEARLPVKIVGAVKCTREVHLLQQAVVVVASAVSQALDLWTCRSRCNSLL